LNEINGSMGFTHANVAVASPVKNGSSIGTMNFTGNTGTFTFSADVDFTAGDVLTIEAPATADATHDELAWALKTVGV